MNRLQCTDICEPCKEKALSIERLEDRDGKEQYRFTCKHKAWYCTGVLGMNASEFHKEVQEELDLQADRLGLMRDYLEDECDLIHDKLNTIMQDLEFVLAELQKSKKKKKA